MSYHSLSECTLDADERREEATRIVLRIIDIPGKTQKEVDFIRNMSRNVPVSVAQLFYLRDLGEKY